MLAVNTETNQSAKPLRSKICYVLAFMSYGMLFISAPIAVLWGKLASPNPGEMVLYPPFVWVVTAILIIGVAVTSIVCGLAFWEHDKKRSQ